MTPAATARGRARREQLLDAAAELVAARGFHAVGIAEIGAAAGVSGAAIYRHFASKEDLLVTLFDRVLDELLEGARDATSTTDPLRDLVERHVTFALRRRSLITIWSSEAHNLPADDRRRLRRKQRSYTELWADAVAEQRPGLGRPAAVALVHGVFGLLNSVSTHSTRITDDELGALLRNAALATLHER